MDRNSGGSSLLLIAAAACLLLTSLDTVTKYGGLAGTFIYLTGGGAAVFLAYRFALRAFLPRLNDRQSIVVFLLIIVTVSVAAAYGYQLANSGRFGPGSDIDDAMIIGANEILAGRFPYYQRTYLGGMLSPFPGTMFLAIPWVIAGIIEFQNIFWLTALFLAAGLALRSYVPALGIVLTLLVFSPTVYQVILTGSDHLANTIYVLIAMWMVITSVKNGTTRRAAAWAVFLGIAMASRSNFLFLYPLIFSAIAQISGVKRALILCGISAVVFAALVVPFWLYDPAAFTPFIIQAEKVKMTESVLPFAGVIIPLVVAAISLALAFRKFSADHFELFAFSAVVQAVALLIPSLLFAVSIGEPSFFLGTAGYGMFTLVFGVVAMWIAIWRGMHVGLTPQEP
ncbi:MAG: hypothetical protein IPM50_14450 [Acidobacteriota bacterium]|nr:MAG: hypothetical protein IPM50_14450 [Acidobacteriota bacterium]